MGAETYTEARLQAQAARCLDCASKPCLRACPAGCSAADFILAVARGEAVDFRRSSAAIAAANPLGWTCGAVCPDTFCVAACARAGIDAPIDIPAVQETIMRRAHQFGGIPEFERPAPSGKRVAVVGAGPAGLAAAALLAQHGHEVEVLDAGEAPGGMVRLIPAFRMDPACLDGDLAFIASLGVRIRCGVAVDDPAALLSTHHAVILASGLGEPLRLGIEGEELACSWIDFLNDPGHLAVAGRRVAVIGGGAVAADCAETAARRGATGVEMIALERLSELPLTARERAGLLASGVEITGRTRVRSIGFAADGSLELSVGRVELPAGEPFHPRAVADVSGSEQRRGGFGVVVVAIGARRPTTPPPRPGLFLAGEVENGPSTVVESVAAGKNAATAVLAFLTGQAAPAVEDRRRCAAILPGRRRGPVPLETDFFGQPLLSPLLLSAAPPSDGYDQMRRAYEAGWAGGVMKTAFADVPIHIPAGYMFAFDDATYGNCDNVSGHDLSRVCREVERLRREFPDRLTIGSTGGPVTGDDVRDATVWVANTRLLERAGACGIEYSLSCPQGGDGTRGDIVSQDAELTAKIVAWVLAAGDPAVPKLFKLTPAVTAILPIALAIRGVFDRFPQAKAGVTLANTFPALAFRPGRKASWDEGVVVGLSGAGIAPISNLTLAKVAGAGLVVSGNGGAMDYRSAADMLALGARTVQCCSVVMQRGFGVVAELHEGLSYLLAARGLASVGELIGCALPDAVTAFPDLPSEKSVSALHADHCIHCGICSRCPYLAISRGADGNPETDPGRCVGCSFCVQRCPSGALFMRERSDAERAALCEA